MDARARVVGGWVLEDELGRGGMGVVWRARARDGRVAALKLVLGGDADSLLRSAREQRLQGALGRAEGFVTLLDAGLDAGRPWLALELLEGGTLRGWLKRGPLRQEDALALARALARAMATAHERGIVHRDLKPENILFDREGRPFVSDLGLAKHYRRDLPGASQSRAMTTEGTGVGTPGYFPLEQAMDAAQAGPAADVFALGAILHEALTGRRAFEATSLTHAVALLDEGLVPTLASRGVTAPAWLEAVLGQALAREPAARFPNAGALAAALDRGAAGPIGSGEGPAARRRRPRRSRRGPALALGAAGLAAVGLGVTGLVAWRRPPGSAGGETAPVAPVASVAAPPPALLATLQVRSVIGERRRKHADEVTAVAFTADGRQVVSGGRDGVVRWWDATGADPDGSAVATGHEVADLALLDDGRALVLGLTSLQLVDPVRGTTVLVAQEPDLPRGTATALELLPDGRAATAHLDGALRLWRLDEPGTPPVRLDLGIGVLWDLALDAPRGRLLIVGNDDGDGGPDDGRGGALWLDLASGERSPALPTSIRIQSRWWGGTPTEDGGVALCGETNDRTEGSLLVVGPTGGIAMQDTKSRVNRVVQRGRTLFGVEFGGVVTARALGGKSRPPVELGRHVRPAVVLALDRAGRRLATGGHDGVVRLWDLTRGADGEVLGATELAPPRGCAGQVRCVLAVHDGLDAVDSLGTDGVLRRHDLATGLELLRRDEPLGAQAYSLSLTPALGAVGVTVRDKRPVVGLSGPRGAVTLTGLTPRVVAPRDLEVAMVGFDGQVVFYRDGKARASPWHVPGAAQALTWSGPDRVLVGTREGAIHTVTRESGAVVASIGSQVAAMAAAPDGRWVAVASESGELGWIVDGKPLPGPTRGFGGLAPRLLAPSSDGRRLAVATRARRGHLEALATALPSQPFAERCVVLVLSAEGARPGRDLAGLSLPVTLDAPTALGWADERTLLVGTARGLVLVVDVP